MNSANVAPGETIVDNVGKASIAFAAKWQALVKLASNVGLLNNWGVAGTHDFSVTAQPSFEVDVTGYKDILVSGDQLVHAASVQRSVQVSVNGGTSWFTTSGDYQDMAATGVGSNNAALFGHTTPTQLARNFVLQIMANTGRNPVDVYVQTRVVHQVFRGSATPINRIRIVGMAAGAASASNFTAGTATVLGR